VLVVSLISSFLLPFSATSLNVALPQMGSDLAADSVSLGWIVTAFMLSAAMFLVPIGRIADMRGRRRIFKIGAWIFAITSLLIALVSSPWAVIALRALQGFGGAMIFGNGTALLAAVYPPHERGRVLGINIGTVYLGQSIGPFVGGLLTEHFGWRSIFAVTALLAVATALITSWKLKSEIQAVQDEKFDWAGSFLYCVMMLGLMYGLSILPAPDGFAYLAAGFACLVAFVHRQNTIAHPILQVGLFRGNTVFALSNLAALLNYGATFAVGFLLSLYLQLVKGLSPQDTGLILLCQPVVMALSSPLAGRFSDRIEPRLLASAGMALTCLGLLVLVSLDADSGLWLVVLILLMHGLGFGLFSSPNTNAVMGAVEKNAYGIASGIMSTMRVMGQMLSMCICMLIMTNFIGRVELGPEHADLLIQASQVTFMVFALMCFGGIVASLARGNVKPHAPGRTQPDP
jgi:EmrB/QacA subfamily drug resistance transporter